MQLVDPLRCQVLDGIPQVALRGPSRQWVANKLVEVCCDVSKALVGSCKACKFSIKVTAEWLCAGGIDDKEAPLVLIDW